MQPEASKAVMDESHLVFDRESRGVNAAVDQRRQVPHERAARHPAMPELEAGGG